MLAKTHELTDVLFNWIAKIKWKVLGLERHSRAWHSRKLLISRKINNAAPIYWAVCVLSNNLNSLIFFKFTIVSNLLGPFLHIYICYTAFNQQDWELSWSFKRSKIKINFSLWQCKTKSLKPDDQVRVACASIMDIFFLLHAFKQQVWHNICFAEFFGLVFNFSSHCWDWDGHIACRWLSPSRELQ